MYSLIRLFVLKALQKKVKIHCHIFKDSHSVFPTSLAISVSDVAAAVPV